MGSFSLSEILTILVVILIVFGPNRLPELARKLGKTIAQARRALASFTEQLESEYGDAAQPLRELKDQYDGVRRDLTDAVTSIGASDPTRKPPTEEAAAEEEEAAADPVPEEVDEEDVAEEQDDADPGAVA